jgi:YebC/PmpR family DNA-binding regulatory protein
MAGHSKWANIKHRKAAQDARRGKIFTKLIRELTVSARSGGGNPEDNPRLRAVIDKALSVNMPRDTIERAIARGVGEDENDNVEELNYEGYAPGGVAVLIEAMTDNRNRTASDVRHAFSKNGGNLGTDGSVAYLFSKKGQISLAPGVDEDKILEVALEAGADDVVTNADGSVDVFTTPQAFGTVKDALTAAGLESAHAEVGMIPATQSVVEDLELVQKVLKLIDMLEDLDDVQNVYTNVDIPQEIMDQLHG